MPLNETILQHIRQEDPSFTEVSLRYQNLTSAEVKELACHLASNKYVTHLDLTGNMLSDDCIKEITERCLYLRSLNLSGNKITDNGLCHFKNNETLSSLDLSYNEITDAGLVFLAENKSLHELSLNGNKIITADILASHSKLTSLSLMNNEINDKGVRKFVENTTLERLNLDDNLLRDEGAVALAKNGGLVELSLGSNFITDKSAIALAEAKNPHLAVLSLAYNSITDQGAAALKNNKTLKKLILAGNQINSMGISELSKSLSITWLDLSHNQVDDLSLMNLTQNKVITHLNLNYNQITAQGAKFLTRMEQLTHLHLSYNSVGDEGAASLAHSRLIYLDVTGNNLGDEAAQPLAENTTIETLILSINNLGDVGAIEIAKSKTLQELMLCYNGVGNAGARALAKCNIKILNLNYNHIDDKGKDALASNPRFGEGNFSLEPIPEYATSRMQLLFTLNQNLFFIVGTDGKIHFCNPAFVRVLGYHESEVLGKNLIEFFHPEDRLKSDPLKRINQKFPTVTMEDRFLCRNGAFRVIRWNAQLRGSCIYSSCTDISVQKKSEREYLRLQRQREFDVARRVEAEAYSKQQTEFIANLSHEVRNPLSCAFTLTELMEDTLQAARQSLSEQKPKEVEQKFMALEEHVKDLRRCIKYPEDILNDNLDIAKISEKKLVLEEKPFCINETILDVVKMSDPEAKKKNILLHFKELSEKVLVKGDISRIKQIILNLIKNAIKFTTQGEDVNKEEGGKKGEVKVSLQVLARVEDSTLLEITVSDTGIGMSKEQVSKLFDRFVQAEHSTYRKYKGSGLGLYLSQQLAELMGGELTVTSTLGVGSTFTCRLRLKSLSPEEEAKIILTEPVSLLPQYDLLLKPKVLIVEDNPMNRKLLLKILQDKFICTEARDGKSALMEHASKTFDLILMDMSMPEMGGVEATEKIRDRERRENIFRTPIIALTANVLERDRNEASKAGVDAILTKPYKREQLITLMNSLIGQTHYSQHQASVAVEKRNSTSLCSGKP